VGRFEFLLNAFADTTLSNDVSKDVAEGNDSKQPSLLSASSLFFLYKDGGM
jgi:hypothetical protein